MACVSIDRCQKECECKARDSSAQVVALIKEAFGSIPAAREPPPPGALPAAGTSAAAAASSSGAHAANGNGANGAAAPVLGPLKGRHEIRPPVVHKWGYGPLLPGACPGIRVRVRACVCMCMYLRSGWRLCLLQWRKQCRSAAASGPLSSPRCLLSRRPLRTPPPAA
jgi:hypothetical protein